MKMMGAMKARTVVENQCRPSTMRMFFFVRVHVWRRKAILDGCLLRGEAILMVTSLLVKAQYSEKVRKCESADGGENATGAVQPVSI